MSALASPPAAAATAIASPSPTGCIASMQHARDWLPLVLERGLRGCAAGPVALDGGAQELLELGLVLALNGLVQALERCNELGVREYGLGILEDAGVAGAGRVLADQQLLIELLPTPEPDIFHGDVAIGV